MPATRLPNEWSILRIACSPHISQEKCLRLARLLSEPISWESLFTLADRHGSVPLLYQALLPLERSVPAEQMAWLKNSYQSNLRKALLLSRELSRLVEHLSAAGISVMPYKGLALAELLYQDISLRTTGDIDLLIRPQDFGRVREAVRHLGYTPHEVLSAAQERASLRTGYECVFDGPAGRNLLEVQWAPQPRFYATDFDVSGLFDRAVTISVAGFPVKTPTPSDLLLLLTVHAAKHVWGRLSWLTDIAQLMQAPDLDWGWIASCAKKLGIVRLLWVTMLLANRLLEAPIPDAVSATLSKDDAAMRFVSEIEKHIDSEATFDVESFSYFQLMLRLRENSWDRCRFLTRLTLTPGPGEWKVVRLPGAFFPLYRIIRLSRLAARIVRA